MLMRWPEDGVGKEVCLASEVDAELARLTTERDAAIARAERAERVAVWAAKRRAHTEHQYETMRQLVWDDAGGMKTEFAGTDAEIYRVLEAEAVAWE